MKTIKRIVFTGGPCSGKTTFTSRVSQIFAERGYRVIIDNESATDLISGGISPATLGMYEFQKYVVALQLKKEELCLKAANEISGDKVIVFIDRGLLDDMSYVGETAFKEILKDFDLKLEELNDRYDMVVHLVTSAKGKEDAYTLANNTARYETIEEARAMDDAALEAWKDHPNRVVIGNEDVFEVKMLKAIQSVFEYLGETAPVEKYSKYLIEINDDVLKHFEKEANYTSSHIIQHYLISTNGNERRIRERIKGEDVLYTYSEASYLSTNERIKVDRVLTRRQYSDYQREIDKNLNVTDKMRYSFINGGIFYKIDVFDFDKSKGLLSIDDSHGGREVIIPEYINIIKDVSGDEKYKNYFLAKSQKY